MDILVNDPVEFNAIAEEYIVEVNRLCRLGSFFSPTIVHGAQAKYSNSDAGNFDPDSQVYRQLMARWLSLTL